MSILQLPHSVSIASTDATSVSNLCERGEVSSSSGVRPMTCLSLHPAVESSTAQPATVSPCSKVRGCWSPLEAQRSVMIPQLPDTFLQPCLRLEPAEDSAAVLPPEVANHYPNIAQGKILRIVAGGQAEPRVQTCAVVSVSNAVAAPGTHNAILGIAAFLKTYCLPESKLYGIRNFMKNDEVEISFESCGRFMNQAGSELLPTIPLLRVTARILGQLTQLCERLELDSLIFLCGPSELCEVAKISDHLVQSNSGTVLACVLHSISGWVRLPQWISTNLGFDSACSVLSEVAGNIALSRQSLNRDIYHFVGCGSKTLTLEVAMQIHPVLCFIGEDVAQRGLTLNAIVGSICDVIVARHHDHGLHAGVVMVSDDFFEQLVEMRRLRLEMQRLRLEQATNMRCVESAQQLLEPDLAEFFAMLPPAVCHGLVFRTGMDGLPLLQATHAERELGALVAQSLIRRAARGERSVPHFDTHPHSLRYLALSPMPTALDCNLGYALGHVAAAMAQGRTNGYVASVENMQEDSRSWGPCAVPIVRLLIPDPQTSLPAVQRRSLSPKDPLFNVWRQLCDHWCYTQSYRQPGPVQYWGPGASRPLSWATYTLRSELMLPEELAGAAKELAALGIPSQSFMLRLEMTFQLCRRREALLLPLQKWRIGYQPALPQVLRAAFHIVEEDGKGRVCADLDLLHSTFPMLWGANMLKAVRLESTHQEASIMHMLPEKPVRSPIMHRDESFARSMGSSQSPSASPVASPRASVEDVTFRMSTSLRVGIVLVGRSGPGVNNVIQGLFDYLHTAGGAVVCIALGLAGLTTCQAFELTEEMLAPHRNQGGCDLLGQSQIEDLNILGQNLAACAATVRKLQLDGLVVWGGRNVHSWTARLAEYFQEQQVPTRVIAVPASVQSDLPLIEQTVGYDTVCKLFSSIVGNLGMQTASSGKVWCFVRIPGRSISHIAAEVALETHPQVVLMSADSGKEQLGLHEVTNMICNIIEARCREDKNYGVVLIPDQLLASVREMKQLFEEVAQIYRAFPGVLQDMEQSKGQDFSFILSLLPPLSRALFHSFPEPVRAQICHVVCEGAHKGLGALLDIAGIETEVIFQSLVEMELARRVVLGSYKGPFQAITYSLPYHGRSAMPTNFDCDLGYTIGYTAAIFVEDERSGLLVDIAKLKGDVQDWEVRGTPLASLLTFKEPKDGASHAASYEIRPRSRLLYDLNTQRCTPEMAQRSLVSPGPAQFEGPCANQKTLTLCMPQMKRVQQMELAEALIHQLKAKAGAGCPPEVLRAVKMLLQGGVDLLKQL